MLNLEKPEAGIRKEVYDVAEKFVDLAHVLFFDEEPNKEQLDAIVGDLLGLVKEGSDFMSIPQNERLVGGLHALSLAQALEMDAVVTYSDEEDDTPADAPDNG